MLCGLQKKDNGKYLVNDGLVMSNTAHNSKDSRTDIKRTIWDLMRAEVTPAGFEHLKPNCFFRISEYRIDVLELRMARPGYNSLYSVSPSSFEIEAGVFFKFAPHPMYATFAGVEGFPIDNAADGHIRMSSHPKRILQSGFNSSWWRADSWKLSKKIIQHDVKNNFSNHLLPWFKKFDDLESVKQHVTAVERDNGKQKIIASPKAWGWVYGFRVLPAYFALQLKQWEEAKHQFSDLIINFDKYGLDPSIKPQILQAIRFAEANMLQTA